MALVMDRLGASESCEEQVLGRWCSKGLPRGDALHEAHALYKDYLQHL